MIQKNTKWETSQDNERIAPEGFIIMFWIANCFDLLARLSTLVMDVKSLLSWCDGFFPVYLTPSQWTGWLCRHVYDFCTLDKASSSPMMILMISMTFLVVFQLINKFLNGVQCNFYTRIIVSSEWFCYVDIVEDMMDCWYMKMLSK